MLYKYDDPLDAPLFLKAYPLEKESNPNFTKRLQVEGDIIKIFCHILIPWDMNGLECTI